MSRHPELGSVIQFDPTKVRFQRQFLDRIRATVPAAKDLADLASLHTVANVATISQVYDSLYAFVRTPEFLADYKYLIDSAIAPHFDAPFRFQRVPGIRIQTPESRTVQYHSDHWYGHGPDVLNFWMPITRSFATNALQLATLEDSEREIAHIIAHKLRQPESDERLKAMSKPVELDYGSVKVFNARTAHGTVGNTTGKTRISIDFRILMEGTDSGSKDPRVYYTSGVEDAPTGTSSDPSAVARAFAYIFPKHGFSRFLPAASQRAVVQAYAKANGMQIVSEETEIFPMSHHPTLLNLAAGKGAEVVPNVVLFSVLCLPEDPAIRAEIYDIAKASGTSLFFANENLAFPAQNATAEIEAAYARLRAA